MTGRKIARSKKIGFLARILLIANILAVIGLSLSYLGLFISPEKNWLLPFFGLFYPYLLLVNIIFTAYWLLKLRIYLFISLLFILIGWNIISRSIQVNLSTAPLPLGSSFQVMTYNVRNMSNNNLHIPNIEIRDAIVKMLQDNQPDVLCLQEFESLGENPVEFIDSLSRLLDLPYYEYTRYNEKATPRINAIITFSRFPILSSKYLKNNNLSSYCHITDISIGGGTCRFFNTHLESVRFRHQDYSFIRDLDFQFDDDENIKEGSMSVFNKLRTAYIIRSRQVKSLRSAIQESPHPVFICGDFNDTPCSYSYQVLSKGKADAFIESGSGLGNTYAGTLPSLRIDYILYDKKFRSYTYTTGRQKLSDHYPVAATIGYRTPAQ
jgi:endonuclease/exonuclease/phosphatase family metal-dependent hydrolase